MIQTTNKFLVCILPDHIVEYVGLHSLSQRSQSRSDHLEVRPIRGREHIRDAVKYVLADFAR